MIRHGVLAAAIAITASRIGFAEKPAVVSHAELAERHGPESLRELTRGAAGAGHSRSSELRPSPPSTYGRKPGKRALRRLRGAGAQAHPCARIQASGEAGVSGVLIRVQDRFGRGPYRPGLTARWSDDDGPIAFPWWTELGLDFAEANSCISDEYHNGCGFRTRDQFEAWFTDREMRALERLGFVLAAVTADVVHFETPTQVVFGSIRPLAQPLRTCRLTSRAALALAA